MFSFHDLYLRQILASRIARSDTTELFLQVFPSKSAAPWGALLLDLPNAAAFLFDTKLIEKFAVLKLSELYLVLVICFP